MQPITLLKAKTMKMRFYLVFTFLFAGTGLTGFCQRIAVLEVELTKPALGIDEPVSIALQDITRDTLLTLVEVQGTKKIPVPFQLEHGDRSMLHWVITSDDKTKRVYELAKGKQPNPSSVTIQNQEGSLTIQGHGKNLLRYQYATVYPPQGIDSAFRRSGFIHPLWTPHGQSLTRIQAPDHYHHYGLWNPWTHVAFEGDTVDFWNLNAKQGTVRFAKFTSITKGPVYGEFKALHEHVVLENSKKKKNEKVALNEIQTVRVYQPGANQNYYIVDITIDMRCAGNSPFTILEYRYAGLGWRATEKWKKDNSEVLTSEGKTRKDADGTTARWSIIQGALDNDYGGAVMMSNPSNYNHPEPLRIWPENSNGGEMFAMFAPTKNKNWLLTPGNTYTLSYRFIVYNGHFTHEKAESGWQYYSAPPKITVKK
jgi:hypothetical protein